MGNGLIRFGVLFLVLAALAAGGYVWLQRDGERSRVPTSGGPLGQTGHLEQTGRSEEADRSEEASHSTQAGYLEQAEHLDALRAEVKEARKNVRSQERIYKRRVNQARRNLQKVQATGNKQLLSLNGRQGFVRLTPTEIQVPEGTFPVTGSLTAEADVAGELIVKRRSTLTRMAAGGVLLGPLGVLLGAAAQKTTHIDEREIYLLIEGDGFASLVICKPNQEKQAFQAAAQIVKAAAFSEAFREALNTDARQAQRELDQAVSSDRNLKAARKGLERVSNRLIEAESGGTPLG